MDRSKRNITKPLRYQTTSLDEDTRQKMHCIKGQNIGTIQDDITDLRTLAENNSSQDNVCMENNYTCVNTHTKPLQYVSNKEYTLLQTPGHYSFQGQVHNSFDKW